MLKWTKIFEEATPNMRNDLQRGLEEFKKVV